MKFKMTTWLDTVSMCPVYGIAVYDGKKKYEAAEDGKLLLFDTEEEAKAKIRELEQRNGSAKREET